MLVARIQKPEFLGGMANRSATKAPYGEVVSEEHESSRSPNPGYGHQSLVKLIWDANNNSAGFSVGASATSCAFAFGRNFRVSPKEIGVPSGMSLTPALTTMTARFGTI